MKICHFLPLHCLFLKKGWFMSPLDLLVVLITFWANCFIGCTQRVIRNIWESHNVPRKPSCCMEKKKKNNIHAKAVYLINRCINVKWKFTVTPFLKKRLNSSGWKYPFIEINSLQKSYPYLVKDFWLCYSYNNYHFPSVKLHHIIDHFLPEEVFLLFLPGSDLKTLEIWGISIKEINS